MNPILKSLSENQKTNRYLPEGLKFNEETSCQKNISSLSFNHKKTQYFQ